MLEHQAEGVKAPLPVCSGIAEGGLVTQEVKYLFVLLSFLTPVFTRRGQEPVWGLVPVGRVSRNGRGPSALGSHLGGHPLHLALLGWVKAMP